jgi:DNA-binding Lrp family transcriptional regulator
VSHKVVTLVYSRRVGTAHRKSILAYLADRASDDGRGVFCSKGTIADETEIARSTVFKTIRDLVDEGVLIEVGTRACKNGATVVYDMNLEVIRAFPGVKSDKSEVPTSPSAGPLPVREPDPNRP